MSGFGLSAELGPNAPGYGALVVSLDLELHWGVRDKVPANGPYRQNLLRVPDAIAEMLGVFHQYGVAATWAAVGFLLARDCRQLQQFSPTLRPRYHNHRLDPYTEDIGYDQLSDPLHFAPSLIEAIKGTANQELATHTFSHYYCLEPGQDRETFRADLQAAVSIARTHGIVHRSIVFPRNQHNPRYDDVLSECGIWSYRGNQGCGLYRESGLPGPVLLKRLGRAADSHANIAGRHTVGWDEIGEPSGLCNVPASFFLRPCSPAGVPLESLRRRRIAASIRHAAQQRRIVHIWWHPHNFGRHLQRNLRFLQSLLDVYAECHDRYDMRSLTMEQVARAAKGKAAGVDDETRPDSTLGSRRGIHPSGLRGAAGEIWPGRGSA